MKKLDFFLQEQRIKKTIPYIKQGVSILDIGCSDGALFNYYKKKGIEFTGVGVDPDIEENIVGNNFVLIKDIFPTSQITDKFDIITALAILEHIPNDKIENFILSCRERLNSGGKIILTVPHPAVDHFLHFLKFFKLIDGMDFGHHHGFEMKSTIQLFANNGFRLVKHKSFQLGLNNIFVFSLVLNC